MKRPQISLVCAGVTIANRRTPDLLHSTVWGETKRSRAGEEAGAAFSES